jgi:hypothetical protein
MVYAPLPTPPVVPADVVMNAAEPLAQFRDISTP